MKRMGGWAFGLVYLALVFAACGAGDENPPPYKTYSYVTNNYSGSVSAFAIDAVTGALAAVAGSPFKAGSDSVGVAVDPSGKFAYVANSGSRDVSSFAIDPATGALAAVAGSPFPAGEGPRSVAVDPSGKFVYVAGFYPYYPVYDVFAFTIDASTGALAAVAGSPFAAGEGPHFVTVDPSGRFLYVTNAGTISVFALDTLTGELAAVAGSPFATGGVGPIAISPSGKFAYALAALPRPPARPRKTEPSADRAYMARGYPDGVAAFAIDAATGVPTAVPGSPFAAGDRACSIAVDPSSRFVYIANGSSDNVSAFSIQEVTGALTAVPGSPFAAGEEPSAVAVDPSGKFVYVANRNSSNVSAFAIDAVTGALTAISGSPFAAGEWPSGLAVIRIAQ